MSLPATSRAQSAALRPADFLVLTWLHRYHYLSSQQLCRLGYSRGSLTYVQTRLKALTDAGYCQRIWVPKRSPHGSAPAVYTLARKGLNFLRAHGVEVTTRLHPSEQAGLSYLFLNHTLEVNDVLIAAELLCRSMPAYRLAGFRHERDLKRHPVRVRDANGRHAAVIPDAWLDLRINGSFQACLALELDPAPRGRGCHALATLYPWVKDIPEKWHLLSDEELTETYLDDIIPESQELQNYYGLRTGAFYGRLSKEESQARREDQAVVKASWIGEAASGEIWNNSEVSKMWRHGYTIGTIIGSEQRRAGYVPVPYVPPVAAPERTG